MRNLSLAVAISAIGCMLTGGAAAADDRDICQMQTGDAAIAACSRAIRSGKLKGKTLALAYAHRGAEWKGKNEIGKALADYGTALKLNPALAAVYNNRGVIASERGEFDRALANYATAIRLDPLYTAAFTNRGLAYEEKKEAVKARADFDAALAMPAKHNDGEWAHKTARDRLEALKGK